MILDGASLRRAMVLGHLLAGRIGMAAIAARLPAAFLDALAMAARIEIENGNQR